MRTMKLFILITLTALFACQSGGETTPSSPAEGTKGMVSSAHPAATEAGLEILRSGGNAFDAAVAVAAALNVVEPMMSGMGGYGTILVYDAKAQHVRFLDSSGKIPMAVDSDVFRAPTPNFKENRRGPKAVSTPGNVNAWEAMSSAYGVLEWEQLFGPAVALADQGFTVSERLSFFIERAFEDFPEHARSFYGKENKPLGAGDLLVQKDLAASLRLIASKGSRAFYEGELAKKIDQAMSDMGSFLSIQDLTADQAEWWEPIFIDYKGYQVFTASPPATAFPSLIRLGLMAELESLTEEHNSADYLHAFSEATKHAFWARLRYAGDPEITPPPLEKLLSENYFREQATKLDHQRASVFQPPGVVTTPDQNTTHFVVADQWGNIVSATQTLGNSFGSRIMPPGTGIWFNNSLAYCTFEPKGNPMDAKPGQRKLSGDCPTIIFKDSEPWAALGTPGGHTIGQTVPQMVMNLIDFNMNISDALAAPRMSFGEPDEIWLERTIDKNVFEALKQRGHNVQEVRGLGNAHGLTLTKTESGFKFFGAADPRGEGVAKGY